MPHFYNYKIDHSSVTHPSGWVEDEFVATMVAMTLHKQGYRCFSNAYCMIARIDRPDWLETMAKQRNCAVANFYNADGSGIQMKWVDDYSRDHSKDTHTICPMVYQKLKKLNVGRNEIVCPATKETELFDVYSKA